MKKKGKRVVPNCVPVKEDAIVDEEKGLVKCAICNEWLGQIQYRHLKLKHNGMTLDEYKNHYPNYPLIAESRKNTGDKNPAKNPEVRKKISENNKGGLPENIKKRLKTWRENGNDVQLSKRMTENNIAKDDTVKEKLSKAIKELYDSGKKERKTWMNKEKELQTKLDRGLVTPDYLKSNKRLYYEDVEFYTKQSYKNFFSEIPNAKNRSREYHLDHKISKDYGYKNNIHPSVIGHYKNLEVVHHSVNESKNVQNSIDLETLIIDINNSKNPLDTRILLTCGGAAGHMAHPFDLPQVKTGKDLAKLFVDSVKSLQENPAAVKIDGINTTLKIVKKNGKTQFALDRGSMNPIDVAGITVDDLGSRFGEGHGMLTIGKKVLDAFNACLPKITSELSSLGMLKDPTILLNVETVIGDTSGKANVIAYKENFFVIHGLLKSEQVTPKRRAQKEIGGSSSKIQSLVDKCKPIMKKEGYGIYGMIPTEVKEKINFNEPMSTTMTVKYNDKKKVTKTLKDWLSTAKNPGATKIKYNDGRTDTAMTKKNYLAILNQTSNLDDMTTDPKAQQMLIDGAVIWHATRLLGNAVIKGLKSEVGNVEEHEGIVIRDPKISSIPFKIVGEFIVSGLQSGFGK